MNDDVDEGPSGSVGALLLRQAKELKQIREMLTRVIFYMTEAEKEVSEKMRRFMMYMHDLHDITYLYEERGHQVPQYMKDELERCDDRLRQMLKEAHTDGGTFEKVRREMAGDEENRWDHAKQLEFKSEGKKQ